jgi:hypothetical protein
MDGSTQLKVWGKDSDQILASAGTTLYMYAPGSANSDHLRLLADTLGDFAEACPERFGFLLHLTKVSAPPPAEDRHRIREAFNRVGARLAGIAIVVEAEGFTGSVLRSAVTTVFVMNRGGFRSKVFPEVNAAAAWLAVQQGVESRQVLDLVSRGQREFGKRS